MREVELSKAAICDIIADMPMPNAQLAIRLEKLVESQVVRPSAPPASNNFFLYDALKEVNRQIELEIKDRKKLAG